MCSKEGVHVFIFVGAWVCLCVWMFEHEQRCCLCYKILLFYIALLFSRAHTYNLCSCDHFSRLLNPTAITTTFLFSTGQMIPNSNLGINSTSGSRFFYLKFFLYLKIQTPWYPCVLAHCILNSQNFPGFLSPPFYPTEWSRRSQLLESPLDRCSTLGQILPVSQFCLKSALSWSSKLHPAPNF